ncbi:hypothetical protein FRX31_024157 [Thalictrum thalictroides]|uniref:ZF-HD dimerization-type domain-containing protein n=1 Tax=Thalictrum thalictroides TaxID=46969 RepID=A0A7J6VMW2_THATH|nr:hypothetical protein FRX31_024157 [Thalictrum thalictroides]
MEVGSGGGGTVTYKECQKNHTISMGSYIKDGCVAFMPNHAKQNGLFCHACGCHRNFHREEVLKATSDDVLDVIPVTVHGKIHGGSSSISNSGLTQSNRGFTKNKTIVDLEDDKFIVVSDDDEVEPVITTESISNKRTATAIKAKKRRFTEEEVKKLDKVCEFLDYKSPGKNGNGVDRVNLVCQDIGISRDSFRKFLHRRRETRGTSRI